MNKNGPTLACLVAGVMCVTASFADSPLFEMHAVAANPDARTKMFSLTRSDHQSETLFLEPEVLLDQRAVKSARVEHETDGTPRIYLNFTEAGQKQFAEVTEKLKGRRLGIVVEGRLQSAPVIRERIP